MVRNFLYNATYQIFVLLVPLVTVPYISRVLGSDGVGINAYTNSVISYFVLMSGMGINLYGNRKVAYVRDDDEELSKTFWEIQLIHMCFSTISLLLFWTILTTTSLFSQYAHYYEFQALFIVADVFDITWLFMGLENFRRTVLRNALVKIISISMIFVLIKTPQDLGKYILLLSLSMLFSNLTLWLGLKKVIKILPFRSLKFKKHVVPIFVLFLPQVSLQIYFVLNKTMIGIFTNVQNVAYYENSDKLVKIVLAIVTATGTVMLPRMANNFANKNYNAMRKLIYTSFDFVSAMSFPLSFGLAAISPTFCLVFFGRQFMILGTLVPILSCIIIFMGWSGVIGTQYLIPTNQNKKYTISVSIGALVSFFANLIFINILGIYGAVLATVICEISVLIVQLCLIRNELNVVMLFEGVWKYLASAAVMYACVRILNKSMGTTVPSFIIQICLGIIVYIVMVLITKGKIVHTFILYFNHK
ncbi:MAG: polysaccharide biosynthesis C-terminal domain-containing protein [Liquorilactobacillus hordei]|uniref:oligosaccharide flippase family protein n=1 Tax=Liquorilactobacillus hordei TaxID=468911 RepID=UPI0039E9B3B9